MIQNKIFLQAYKQQVFGNKYVWIIVGWYNEDWWKKRDVECNGEQLLEAAANLIETYPLPLSSSTEPTISKRVSPTLQLILTFICNVNIFFVYLGKC